MAKTKEEIMKEIKVMQAKTTARAVELADVDGEIYDKGIVVGALTAFEKVLKLFD